jgi:hypothetical protein
MKIYSRSLICWAKRNPTSFRIKTAQNKIEKQRPIRIQNCNQDQIKGLAFSFNPDSLTLSVSQKEERKGWEGIDWDKE